MLELDDSSDVREFLKNRGQRGPRLQNLRHGTYTTNLAQFVVITQGGVRYLQLSRDEAEAFRSTAEVIGKREGLQPVVIGSATR